VKLVESMSEARKETLKSHQTPSRPWQYVADDLFELEGKSYLVTSDYFSDFFELEPPQKHNVDVCYQEAQSTVRKARHTGTASY